MKSFRTQILNWLPRLSYQVWLLAFGRLLSQVGSGFTLFYAPIFFVNQVGLSATAVGIALGSSSISGVVGRFLGGSLADSPRWGRKPAILLSAAFSAIASFVLATTQNFSVLLLGNLLMGLGVGLYWPATEALVADMTTPAQRNEAFALNRLADSLGLGLGVVLAGLLIQLTGAFRALFVIDGLSFLVFFVIVSWAIAVPPPTGHPQPLLAGWRKALADRTLLVFIPVNVLFTMYIVQIYSTMPLYFTNFVAISETVKGFSASTISALFTWHLVLTVLLQLPAARWLNRLRRPQALILSVLLWGTGFALIGMAGVMGSTAIVWAVIGLAVLSIATVTYLPSASALVVDLAPPSQRGVYLSINSQCWALGYFIGPPLGGLTLDQPGALPHLFWLGLTGSIGIAIVILRQLDRIMLIRKQANPEINNTVDLPPDS
ncbi:MFS transporter [Leptolyngbya sp. 'hensonii']|uniref:MFS transporter n=1 Tax=Leptolyngbya sp. 'hensonii' TaxID=1922337 RepID=UPI00094FF67E|nr:MFS transporter [Leptolyngbya sp. 'hensonii']OLP15974.1 MFS transporter [Leptolyngbya sp. 'hensonii']